MRHLTCLCAIAATALLGACDPEMLAGITPPVNEPTTTSVTFVLASSCHGRLNSAVSIYVDNRFLGTTSGELHAEVTPGVRRLEAFTAGRAKNWGPTDVQFEPGRLRYTLHCNG